MEKNRIEIAGQTLTIPNAFQRLDSMPDDPKDSVVYGVRNSETICYVIIYPIDRSQAMPFDTELVSKGIHSALGEKQGLIDIQAVHTNEGLKSVYSIVKTLKEPSGVQYNLTLQIAFPDQMLHVQGYFEEAGITGQRDSMVYQIAVQKGLLEEDANDSWGEDPFDKEYRNGVLKNLSENEEYDSLFPDHPLSILRAFIRTILNINHETVEDGSSTKDSLEQNKNPEITDGTSGSSESPVEEPVSESVEGLDIKALEETLNEILPGIAMYVRDVNLNDKCLASYEPGTILMERGFTDASCRVMGMKTRHRITILSNHMADFGEFEHGTGWGLFVANHGSHFKVLDVYEYQGKTQILLLHLPDDERWKLFPKIEINIEKNLIEDSRKRFENKCVQEVVPELDTEEWRDRCRNPIGMDIDGHLFDIDEQVRHENDAVLNIEYQIIVQGIMQRLTDDKQKNIAWLHTAMERYKDHPLGSEIIKACMRKLYELLPEDQREKLDQAIGKDMDSIEEQLNKIRTLIMNNKPEEAKPLMDALANKVDENPMFREDEVSQYFRFREWFEECLYRHMYQPKKEIHRAEFPYDDIYALQGSMYIDLNDLEKARECLRKALSWNPVNAQISFEYAETFKIAGDMETFFEESKKIQKISLHNRDVARFLRNTGYYFTETGKYKEAMMCFMRSLLFDGDSKTAKSEIDYLHQNFDIEIAMPDAEACREFAKQYGFDLGADNDLLGMLYAYGKHFMDEKQEDGAAYCFGILYELTDDPKIKNILGQLGVKVDSESPSASDNKDTSGKPGTLYLKNSKADARGMVTDSGFVVFAGSRIFATPTKSCPESIRALRKKYKKHIDADMILQKDLTFTSASQAASFVLFASTNGLTSWVDGDGNTLKSLQG